MLDARPPELSPPLPARAHASATAKTVDAWCALDHRHAILEADRAVIDATRPLRSLVVELFSEKPGALGRDLLHALGALGRASAERGGSPTLVAALVDTLLLAVEADGDGSAANGLPSMLDAFAIPARAAVLESYVLTMTAAQRDAAHREWEYPACVVPVDAGLVAIAAGHPDDDAEALTGWAARVAHGVSLAGFRRAVVGGSDAAVAAVMDALDLAGVQALRKDAPPAGRASARTRAAASR